MDRLSEWFADEGERRLAEVMWGCFEVFSESYGRVITDSNPYNFDVIGELKTHGRFIYENEHGKIKCDIQTILQTADKSCEWICFMSCDKKIVFQWRIYYTKNFVETHVERNLFTKVSHNHPVPQTDDFWVRLLTARFDFQPTTRTRQELCHESMMTMLKEMGEKISKSSPIESSFVDSLRREVSLLYSPLKSQTSKNLLHECWQRYRSTCSNCGWNRATSSSTKNDDRIYYPLNDNATKTMLTQHIDLWLRMDTYSDRPFEPKSTVWDYNYHRYRLADNKTYVTGYRQVNIYYNHQRRRTFFRIAKKKRDQIVDTYLIIGDYDRGYSCDISYVRCSMTQTYSLYHSDGYHYELFRSYERESFTSDCLPHIQIEFLDNHCTPKRVSVLCSNHNDNVAYKLMQDLDLQIPMTAHDKNTFTALLLTILVNVPKELVSMMVDYCPGQIKDAEKYGKDTWIYSETLAEQQARNDQYRKQLKEEREKNKDGPFDFDPLSC